MNWQALWIPIISNLAAMWLVDLQGYIARRQHDPAARFDYTLFAFRTAVGFVAGLAAGLGVGATTNPSTGGP